MDSIVCWYDIGKQQCTNESMASNPVLADLSGNGHDITCYNFAWAGMSGIGGYNTDFANATIWTRDNNKLQFKEYTSNKITISNIEGLSAIAYQNFRYGKNDSLTFMVKVSTKCKIVERKFETDTASPSVTNTLYELEANVPTKITIADIDSAYQTRWIFFNNWWAEDGNTLTIEQLPLYPNALVSDGVDDYCYTDGLPILTDYTVIAKRKILADVVSALASKASNNNSTDGAFIFDARNGGGYIACNFGANNALDELYPEDVSYQTKESYNGNPIIKLNNVDTDKLSLFTFSAQNNLISQYALYSFLLFDRTLTTAEIEWVKQNMIESGRKSYSG